MPIKSLKYLLSIIWSIIAINISFGVSIPTPVTLQIPSGQNLRVALSSDFTNATVTVDTNLQGYFCVSNATGTIRWFVDPQQFIPSVYNTNIVMGINVVTTNGAAFQRPYYYGFELFLYTNVFANNGFAANSTSNLWNVYYDSGLITTTNLFPNGTNLSFISVTNQIVTNKFAITNMVINTNIAFGVLSLTHWSVAGTNMFGSISNNGAVGTEWIINGRITEKH